MSEDVSAPALPQTLKSAPTILKLNHTHEAIARWLLENPTASLGACARYFNYTQAWLSCIIHSDAFQVKLHRMQQEADAVVVLDVPARLRGVAAAALDGIAHQVDHAIQDGNGVIHRQFLHDTAELTLKALGYGAPKAPAPPAIGALHYHQHDHKHATVAPEVLANAREKLLESHEVQETREFPASGDSDNRPVQRSTALIPATSTTEGTETSRADLSSQSGGVAP